MDSEPEPDVTPPPAPLNMDGLDITSSPTPSTTSLSASSFGSEQEAIANTRASQISAYRALVSDGGRPSHPISMLEDVVKAPGPYRDILAFWQDRTDDWRVFDKQWGQWREFRTHQSFVRDPTKFPVYVKELESRLLQRGFEFSASCGTPSAGLSLHAGRQDKIATWIEYLNHEYIKRESYDRWMAACKPGYDQAWDRLIRSGALYPSETSIMHVNDLCNPSPSQIARHNFERRKAREIYRAAVAATTIHENANRDELQFTSTERDRLNEATRNLRHIENRANGIAEFKRKTNAYRFALDKAERHDLLLHWILDQFPAIKAEMQALPTCMRAGVVIPWRNDPGQPRQFHCFRRLAPEIRRKIWLHCLPPQPTAHFFDVLNHPRKRHLAPYWSSKEFRLRASRTRNSGYQIVYPLVASCQEARMVIAAYYRMEPTASIAGHISVCGYNFSNCDWIPAEDLVVLAFPPIEDQLPTENAITFAIGPGRVARNVGLLFPMELILMSNLGPVDYGDDEIDDITQLYIIPQFLQELRQSHHLERRSRHTSLISHVDDDDSESSAQEVGGGVENLYFIVEGWEATIHNTESTPRPQPAEALVETCQGPLSWSFQMSLHNEGAVPWPRTGQLPPLSQDQERLIWWLGSGDKALVLGLPRDMSEQNAGRDIAVHSSRINEACEAFGWDEFAWTQTLGWMSC